MAAIQFGHLKLLRRRCASAPASYFDVTCLNCLGYSLQLTRNLESDLVESESLTAQWTSDVLSVVAEVICLTVDWVLPSSVQAKLFLESQNGTVWNRSVFTSGSVSGDRIRGGFQVTVDRDASKIQLTVYFNANATIKNIRLEFGPCHENGNHTWKTVNIQERLQKALASLSHP